MESRPKEQWGNASAYEFYVGRWSRQVAREFLKWMGRPAGGHWLDVGCGTGALTRNIIDTAAPSRVDGLDRTVHYATFAREQIISRNVNILTGDAQALPFATGIYDAVVSGLVLNFVPEPQQAVREMVRVAKSGSIVAVYIWDYAGKMEFMRHFWDAAIELNEKVRELDEGPRFPICQPGPLAESFRSAGLRDVQTRAIDIPTVFQGFDDYWLPFLGGQGPAPTYLASLDLEHRVQLREHIRARLPLAPDGSIPLAARAWAARGIR